MMTLDRFEALSHFEKTEAILKGTFLADRLTEKHYIRLYNINNFYVEVLFDDRTHIIGYFRAFKHIDFVMPYLERVRLAV